MIDVFRIGIHLGMTSNSTQVLGLMLRELGLVHGGVDALSGQFAKLKLAAAGAIAAFAGVEALKGIWAIVDASKELNLQLEKTKQLGGDFAANLSATRLAAFRTSVAVPTTTPADNVRMARELGTTVGHPDQALSILPDAAKTAFVISHYTGENAEEIIKNLARTADARAQIYTKGADGQEHVDPTRLQAELDAAAKALILGGGFMKSSDLLQMARQGGAAVKGQTPEAFYAAGVEAAIAMGASKLGTAETGLYQQFIGGTMTKKVAEHLTEAGLLHPGDWHSGRSGGVVVNPQVAQRFQPMMSDPIAWLTTGAGSQAIKSYAAKEGIDTMMAIFQLFGRQTVQRLVSEATSNEPQFERARHIYGNIPSVKDQYQELQANDLDTNVKSLTAAWQGLMQALGEQGVPLAISVLHGLTDALHALMQVAVEHPGWTQGLLLVATGLASMAALGGSLVVLGVALGPFATGLRLLVGAASATSALTAAGTLTTLAGGVSALVAALSGAAAAAASALALAAGLGVLAGIAKLGSDYETPETRKKLEDLNRARRQDGNTINDGFDASGRPIQKQSFQAPASDSAKPIQINFTHTTMLDGKVLARSTTRHLTNEIDAPSRGTTGFDPTMTPQFSGAMVNA